MPTITLKNIPDPLYEKLKAAARLSHRSLNSEIIYCVERVLETHKIDVKEHVGLAQQLRLATAGHLLTDEQLNEAKRQDRP
ncbi:MAG: Arc family DNA-binding protein [Phormidesmis sp.]